MEQLFILAIYAVIAYLIAKEGDKRKIGFSTSLILCLVLSPFIGGIITMLSPKTIKP